MTAALFFRREDPSTSSTEAWEHSSTSWGEIVKMCLYRLLTKVNGCAYDYPVVVAITIGVVMSGCYESSLAADEESH